MKVECPICKNETDVTDKLPDCASCEAEIECECGAILEIGWYATAEVRNVIKAGG